MTVTDISPEAAELERLRDENAELHLRVMELEAANRELVTELAWNNGGISE
ncbi:coiled-coil domain-containing protein [Mycobacterium sp. ML4]